MDLGFQQVVKASQQSLHNKCWQSRARKETHTQELDDVQMAEGAHQLTFSYKLCGSTTGVGIVVVLVGMGSSLVVDGVGT